MCVCVCVCVGCVLVIDSSAQSESDVSVSTERERERERDRERERKAELELIASSFQIAPRCDSSFQLYCRIVCVKYFITWLTSLAKLGSASYPSCHGERSSMYQ